MRFCANVCSQPRVVCHISHITCHMSHVKCYMSPPTICHTSYITSVECHASHIMCHFFLLKRSVGARWWRVCHQWDLPCLVYEIINFKMFIILTQYTVYRVHSVQSTQNTVYCTVLVTVKPHLLAS